MSVSASSKQLEILRLAVDPYCADCGMFDADERLYIAELVGALFELGALDLDDLRRGLDWPAAGFSDTRLS